jgi:hypothetical protein
VYEYLVEKFAGDQNVRVILDRREGERPHPAVEAAIDAADRRQHTIDDKIRARGLAILLQA